MTTLLELQAEVTAAKKVLAVAEQAVADFATLPENNVFPTMDNAESALENKLTNQASADCEGSHNYGLDEYKQEFIVDGKHYVATLKVEYNRHDKTYYYVDGTDFTVAPL